MKIVFAALVSCALATAPAWADDVYRSTVSGTVKIDIVRPKSTPAADQAQAPQTPQKLTIELALPPEPADGAAATEEATQEERLKSCDRKWAKKVAENADNNGYQAYAEQHAGSAAQAAPPRLVLMRLQYRQCMYECLGLEHADCPGGMPPDKK